MNRINRSLPGVLRLAGLSIAVALSAVASIAACERGAQSRSADAATRDRRTQADAPGRIVVDGHERLQWEQAGPSLEEIKRYRYMAVVGRRPSDLKNVTCAPQRSGGAFLCSSALPPMTRGVHQVWVIAVATDGKRVLVSRWEPPLTLQKR
jgi:hypothetical protein